MLFKDLKDFLADDLSGKEYDEYEVCNGNYATMEGDEDYYYRIDTPIVGVIADTDSKEIVFLHQLPEEISNIKGGSSNE